MGKQTIALGQKFGKLTIVSKHGKLLTSPKRTVYNCLCDCGNLKLMDAGNLRKPGERSCGCVRRQQAVEKGKKQRTQKSYLNLLYGESKRNAKSRNIAFSLDKEQFKLLITKNCYYCGDEPKNRNRFKVGVEFPTLGIDRANNSLGYEINNCRPCCSVCNTMKLDLTEEAFYEHLHKIVNRL